MVNHESCSFKKQLNIEYIKSHSNVCMVECLNVLLKILKCKNDINSLK